MSVARDIQSLIDAAEKAAAGGDFAQAESQLRSAARLQESRLGAEHPDLAKTLNNLAVACEMTNKQDDAEAFYRRAYAVATASLPPGHALVTASLENLREFCTVRGLPIDRESAAPPKPALARQTQRRQVPVLPATDTAPSRSAASSGPPRWLAPAATVMVLMAALVAAGLFWRSSSRAPEAAEAALAETAAPEPPLAPPPDLDAPAPLVADATPNPEAASAPPVSAAPEPEPPPPAPAATPAPRAEPAVEGMPAIVGARMCRDLSTVGAWSCEPLGNPVAPGRLHFLTPVVSTTGATVQHRWFNGERLVQSVTLRAGANPGSGYRTYSRQTVGSGEWRVEALGADGRVLAEQRFVVR